MCYSPLVAKSKTEFNIINFLALYWKCACVGPIFLKMHSQNVFISQEKKQIPIIGYVRVFKEYLYKSKIWQSETSPNQGIPNQVPWLGLLWVFLNTLKYPKMEICYFFLCIRKFLELHCGHKNSISLDSDLPKKRPAHNVFEVTALCRTRADILKPTLDSRTLVASRITKN